MNKHNLFQSVSQKKKVLLTTSILVLSVSVFAISTVFALYTNNHKLDNTMQTSTSEMVLNEIFNEKDQWLAGETKQKEVSFENTGEIQQLVRFTVIPKWLMPDGSDEWVEWPDAEADAVEVHFTDACFDEWTEIDGYYYYNSTLNPNTETNKVIDTVIFSSDLDNGGYGSLLDYSDKKYSLTVEMEAIEVNPDVSLSQWGVNYTQADHVITWQIIE